MYKFKDAPLKEATLATIIDQFQHDYSSKMALFIESKNTLCKSCNGDSDSLIFLTPVQSMKLGMSILDTFHERKLKKLNQRLQYMILNYFTNKQNNSEDIDENNQNLFQNFYQKQFNKKEKDFPQLDILTRYSKSSTLFNPIGKLKERFSFKILYHLK